nr:putative aminotransferase c6b12.04c [Quercus suber]
MFDCGVYCIVIGAYYMLDLLLPDRIDSSAWRRLCAVVVNRATSLSRLEAFPSLHEYATVPTMSRGSTSSIVIKRLVPQRINTVKSQVFHSKHHGEGSIQARGQSGWTKARCLVGKSYPRPLVRCSLNRWSRSIVNEAAQASPIQPIVNMGQGFFGYNPPDFVLNAAKDAIDRVECNQYSPTKVRTNKRPCCRLAAKALQ